MRLRLSIVLLILHTPLLAQSGDSGDYVGPALLSRGTEGGAPSAPISFRPYINLSAIYGDGLTTAETPPTGGRVPDYGYAGGEAAAGVYGYHSSRHTTVGLEYRGDYRQYHGTSNFRGTNQFLVLGVNHRVNRRLTVTLREGAGTFNQGTGYMGTFGFYDQSFAQIPQNEVLDTRTSYFTTMADVTYNRTARLSFNFGGTGFTVRRRVSSFYSVTGYSARADVGYRVSRRSTIGVDYFFSHYEFNKAFGSADLHSVAANYSTRLSRDWKMGLRAGVIRVETLGVGTVQLDPVIAALIGRATGIRAFYEVSYAPAFWLQLSRSVGHGNLHINGQYGASPGNGVYLTSRQRTVSAAYSYTGRRRWSVTADMRYSDMRSVGQDIGRYETVGSAVSVVRHMRHNAFATCRYEVRRYLSGLSYHRYFQIASIGVAYSPGERPLRLW